MRVITVLLVGFLTTLNAFAGIPADSVSWDQYVAQLRQEALSDGIRADVFDSAFAGVVPDRKTLSLSRSQPEKRLSYLTYRKTRGDSYRIKLGAQEFRKNQALLQRISNSYGVSPCVVTALWGIETSYGRYMGNFPVIKSLATLSYSSPRSDYFHEQLLYGLRIVNDGHIDLGHFKGEWAGASGQPQFMPSSWAHYAVDYDGDGRKDIWESKPDALASIANYLREHGWQSGEPWYYEVNVPAGLRGFVDTNHRESVSSWADKGVVLSNGQPLPNSRAQAAIIEPDGGPYLLVFPNFDVIKTYNNSTYYAGTVGYMATQICSQAGYA